MKNILYLATVALLLCGIGMAQSSSSTSQSTSTPQASQNPPTPPGDTRDKYGDTIAPGGTDAPKGTNAPNVKQNNQQPTSMGSSTAQNDQNHPTPPGDTRDKYGDTIAPDGTDAPKGTNAPNVH